MESVVTSLVMEGVFRRFPKLRIALVESGFVWVPSLCWRLDRLWERMRDEVPHLKRPPSEYIRQNIWYTTQPIEEPANPEHLRETIDWIGWDRLMFSTDYPHWDYDDPTYAFKFQMTAQQREALFYGNAAQVYRLRIAVALLPIRRMPRVHQGFHVRRGRTAGRGARGGRCALRLNLILTGALRRAGCHRRRGFRTGSKSASVTAAMQSPSLPDTGKFHCVLCVVATQAPVVPEGAVVVAAFAVSTIISVERAQGASPSLAPRDPGKPPTGPPQAV